LTENILDIKNLNKSYYNDGGTRLIILESINLKIKNVNEDGSFISILAPLGSGKTTLLKIIAGLENYEGEVNLYNKRVGEPNGEIIYIPEKPSSLPWLNVKENIELPSKLTRRSNRRFTISTSELIDSVGLSAYENYYTSSLPSGFRLRIEIARALSFNPKIILLDDVLKNLDGETSSELIELLINLTSAKSISFLLATTNISDAILLSQKIFLMRKNPGQIIKEIDIPKHSQTDNSEIITKYKNEIEYAFKSQGMLHCVLVSL
jgi:NitT/TauT family transport system ATP-binding protein